MRVGGAWGTGAEGHSHHTDGRQWLGKGEGHPGHGTGLVTGGRCRHPDPVTDVGRWFGSGYGGAR